MYAVCQRDHFCFSVAGKFQCFQCTHGIARKTDPDDHIFFPDPDQLLKNLAAAVLTGAAMWGCETLLYRPELSKLLTLLEFCALGLVGIGLYAGICWLLREREALQTIVQKFRKRA